MRFFTGTVLVLSVAAASLVSAQPSIEVGSHDLLPNTPGQTIEVFVTGGQAVETVNLNAQIADGFNTDGPIIQSVDLVTATIFAPPNNDGGQFDSLNLPQIVGSTVVTPLSTTVDADGLLATITVDTTGVFGGTYDLSLTGTRNGDTNFGFDSGDNLIEPVVTNGQISIVPEPASALILAAGGGLLLARRRRR